MADSSKTPPLMAGFDFLKGLSGQAQKGFEGLGGGFSTLQQWVAPTLDPKELDKRIEELKTVQFWLEQNARLLATTVQALEVQKLTLATLQSMNLRMPDLQEILRARTPSTAEGKARPEAATPNAASDSSATSPDDGGTPDRAQAAAASATGSVGLDPMKWWGALTEQFTTLAAQAMNNAGTDHAAAPASPRARNTRPSAKTAGSRPTANTVSAKGSAGPSSGKSTRKTAGPSARSTARTPSSRKTGGD